MSIEKLNLLIALKNYDNDPDIEKGVRLTIETLIEISITEIATIEDITLSCFKKVIQTLFYLLHK